MPVITFLQPDMGGWMAPVFIVTAGLIEQGLICSNLLHFISITGRRCVGA